ncbi:Mov34/MPN/PAD-1 family protein [Chitinimonas koreensis]|uniref:Mov34/MPN/PAD-1 family protein n=1 Tax=Chitinimonas koreensis TaxID=356302 RepID=UPI0004055F6E|nr:M67 family metallopeptidase [Chitinimonas koreensis]QNM95308.1 M67 family metallopeptidase [Chitinimonas koreensis]
MLTLPEPLAAALMAHAWSQHPLEACGLLAGPAGSGRPTRLVPMRNAAQSSRFFAFEPREQLRVWRELEAGDEEVVALYHSHTGSPAYPSRDDVLYATDPALRYLIASTAPPYSGGLRSFRIVGGRVSEETIRFLAAPA